jgi:zinc/manganese transport system ATP-binding protein
MKLGGRVIWKDLDLEIRAGEFVAVLGPNGAGKTSLLKALLGLVPLSEGLIEVCARAPRRGSSDVGYVPQRQNFDPDVPLRGIDLVRLGLDGHRFGPMFSRSRSDRKVREVTKEVGASAYAYAPLGRLSGGEQQRLRIAQALVGDPKLLLCDEPLLSLDLSHQQAVSALIDERRKKYDTAVIFVTHEINPVLPLVDRVLYLVNGRFAIGKPNEVMTTETLSHLYGTKVEVINVSGRIIVVGGGDAPLEADGGHHGAHGARGGR